MKKIETTLILNKKKTNKRNRRITMSYTKSMFDSIKKTLQENGKRGNSNFKDFLKFAPGNTYIVRLLPNVNNPENTFFHYYHYGWNSISTGQYVEVLSPKTWGDPDPIEGERIKLYRNKSDKHALDLAKNIYTKEKWLVNVYVIEDPTNSENNGTVKVLRYGSQLSKIINSAIDGEDAEEFGAAIFDLSENGCNLKIRVESTKEGKDTRAFVNYTSSRFTRASAIPNMTAEKAKEILDNLHDLTSYFPRKSPAELKETLSVHLYGKGDDTGKTETPIEEVEETKTTKENPAKTESKPSSVDDDDKIKKLLEGL